MKKSNLLNTLILAALAVPGITMAAETSPFSGNVSLVTDYLYRGISQTGGGPALQGGFDYAHPSGFYIGAWGSNVSWVAATSASLELDTYLGFKNKFAGDFNYDVGFLRYNYPGVYPDPIPAPGAKADTNEIYGLIGWKWITLKYSDSLGDTFGLADASGTSYIDLSASYTLEESGVTLSAHYGDQSYKGTNADAKKADTTSGTVAGVSQDPSYTDWKVSVSKDFSGYVWGLTYSSTDAKDGGYYTITQADGSTTNLGKGTAVLSVSHAM